MDDVAHESRCESETGGGAFLFGVLVENGQLQAERFGQWESLAKVTDKTGEGIQALGGAVLRLAVGKSGGASEPSPISGAAICAELLGKCFGGKCSKLLESGCSCRSHAWKLPGLVSTTAAGL